MAAEPTSSDSSAAGNLSVEPIPGWFQAIKDEQYASLERTFLASGKGRRPNLPPLLLNNRLILQLYALMQESNETWKMLHVEL
ncbi:hypothetical protein ElyMa_002313200 [Elysia marginata]|uniref:ARID domain-containing protein n=1 Tax=Elysia marginata TaxID=1093978 RepID=A0AAV4G5W2_9GAST|nr:hypothetical protein ElyMa_002313200 [Elysia marginata]